DPAAAGGDVAGDGGVADRQAQAADAVQVGADKVEAAAGAGCREVAGDRAAVDQHAAAGVEAVDAAAAGGGRVAGDGRVADGHAAGVVAEEVQAAAAAVGGRVAGDAAAVDEQVVAEGDVDAAAGA